MAIKVIILKEIVLKKTSLSDVLRFLGWEFDKSLSISHAAMVYTKGSEKIVISLDGETMLKY